MDLGLKNKVFIAGMGARGIGAGIVQVLLEEGANVAIVGSSREDNLKLQKEIEKYGNELLLVEGGSGEPAHCKKAVDTIVQKYGRIEGLVNKADLHNTVVSRTGNNEQFLRDLHNNLAEYYLLTHFALPYLKISGGAIVNIISKTAETDQDNSSSHAAANGGRMALTREWAVELLKYSIRVNAVVVTEGHTPPYRKADSLGIAHMVAFLLSEKSSHTTGQLIHVEGNYIHTDIALANA